MWLLAFRLSALAPPSSVGDTRGKRTHFHRGTGLQRDRQTARPTDQRTSRPYRPKKTTARTTTINTVTAVTTCRSRLLQGRDWSASFSQDKQLTVSCEPPQDSRPACPSPRPQFRPCLWLSHEHTRSLGQRVRFESALHGLEN